MRGVLASLPGMHWNSAVDDLLHDLGRKFERSIIDEEGVLLALEHAYPLVMNRHAKKAIMKALR